MATKTLNTRIKLKYDTLVNWTTNNPVLLQGEVAVVAVPSEPTQLYDSVSAPQILFKVGDGSSTFTQLPWASGLAADVYSWAKAQNLEWSAANTEHFLSGLSAYISEQTGLSNFYTKAEVNVISTALSTAAKDYTDNAVADLDATVESAYAVADQQQVVTGVKVTEVDGKLSAVELSAVTLAKVAKTGKAEDVSLSASAVGEKFTSTDVQAGFGELYQMIETGGTGSVVTLSSTAGTGDVLKTYTIYQGGNSVGSIDIPKDFLVKSAEVKVCQVKDDPVSGLNVGDKYLDFTVNTKDDTSGTGTHMYIPIKSFADAYTGHTGTNIDVTISDYVVSADLTQAVKTDIAAKAYLSDVNAMTISGENGLSSSGDLGTGIKVGHSTTGVAIAEQAGKFIKSVTVDAYGHVTGGTLSAVNVTTDLYQPDGDYLILDCGSSSTVI